MFDSKIMGKRIRKLRGAVPQDELAKDLGITQQTLSRYENGERNPDAEILYRMSEHFEVSANYLLGLLDDVESLDMGTLEIFKSLKPCPLCGRKVKGYFDSYYWSFYVTCEKCGLKVRVGHEGLEGNKNRSFDLVKKHINEIADIWNNRTENEV